MADVTNIDSKRPAPFEVCGRLVAYIDDGWYVFRWRHPRCRTTAAGIFRTMAGPFDTPQEAERAARRQTIRPLRNTKGHHDRAD